MKREDMKDYAKFRATCTTCGQRQPRATTYYTAGNWMQQHEQGHRAAALDPARLEGDPMEVGRRG